MLGKAVRHQRAATNSAWWYLEEHDELKAENERLKAQLQQQATNGAD
jgi:cell shape-determining protein MreC